MKFLKMFLTAFKDEKNNIIKFLISPIIGALLVGYVFSNPFVQNIPFAIVDNDNSTLSRSIISQLKNTPTLNINLYLDSESDLEKAIDSKKVGGGIIIPKDFAKDVSLSKSPKALILVDGTNMLIGGNALAGCSTVLGTINAGAQLSILQGRGLLPYTAKQTISNFSYVERILYEPQSSYLRNLIYTIVPFMVQMFFLTTFIVPLLIKKRKELESKKIFSKDGLECILNFLFRVIIISTVFVISSFMALCVIKKVFNIHLRGDILIYAALMYLFLINLTVIALVLAAIFDNASYVLLLYQLSNYAIIITCGVTYPIYMMPDGFADKIKAIWPFIHVALPLKYINLKGVGWDAVMPFIRDGFRYTLFWLPVGIVLYFLKIKIKKYKNKKMLANEENLEIALK